MNGSVFGAAGFPHDGEYFDHEAGDDKDRRHGDAHGAVYFFIVEYFWIAAFTAGHQEKAQGDHGQADQHPGIIFFAEQRIGNGRLFFINAHSSNNKGCNLV
jgi:hypothetical protein